MNAPLEKRSFNKFFHVPFSYVKINDEFWSNRQSINRTVSLNLIYQKLEEDFHIDNFRVASGIKKGIQKGDFYFDSDLYKWLEGACYYLHLENDGELQKKVNIIVELIEKSQLKDGYINTFYSTKFVERRFTNLLELHELYCAGHLIEAAIAHYNATDDKKLSKVAEKFANLIVRKILVEERKETSGHPEIELALFKLSNLYKSKKYIELAKYLIDMRGKIPHFKLYAIREFLNMQDTLKIANKIKQEYFLENNLTDPAKDEVVEFLEELSLKEWINLISETLNGKRFQLDVAVRKAKEPVGHSVRAMYLYCGIADLYSETGEEMLINVLEKIWLKMVKARMYITGGTGSIKGSEGFQKDFNLKNENSYSETCAAIANILWNWRMLQITGKCKYADLMEKLLYNAFLVGQSIDGKKYFYENLLISQGYNERKEWFKCACCPTNVIRIIPSLGQFLYSSSVKGIWIHQYIGSKVNFMNNGIELLQESEFPWNGNVKLLLSLKNVSKFSIFLRIPKWCNEMDLYINNEKYQDTYMPGTYVEILRNWKNDDTININFRMVPKLEKSDLRIKSNRGKIAISHGPLIYCIEQIDNKEIDILDMKISKIPNLKVIYDHTMLGGMNIIRGNLVQGNNFTAIPYYAWANRGPDKMQVWHKIDN
ncbi:MAG: glycoside hydrolase family 127 protein [Promethearchaeota archaeon]